MGVSITPLDWFFIILISPTLVSVLLKGYKCSVCNKFVEEYIEYPIDEQPVPLLLLGFMWDVVKLVVDHMHNFPPMVSLHYINTPERSKARGLQYETDTVAVFVDLAVNVFVIIRFYQATIWFASWIYRGLFSRTRFPDPPKKTIAVLVGLAWIVYCELF